MPKTQMTNALRVNILRNALNDLANSAAHRALTAEREALDTAIIAFASAWDKTTEAEVLRRYGHLKRLDAVRFSDHAGITVRCMPCSFAGIMSESLSNPAWPEQAMRIGSGALLSVSATFKTSEQIFAAVPSQSAAEPIWDGDIDKLISQAAPFEDAAVQAAVNDLRDQVGRTHTAARAVVDQIRKATLAMGPLLHAPRIEELLDSWPEVRRFMPKDVELPKATTSALAPDPEIAALLRLPS